MPAGIAKSRPADLQCRYTRSSTSFRAGVRCAGLDTRNSSSISSAVASRPFSATTGGGSFTMELQLNKTDRMTSTTMDGMRVGATRTIKVSQCVSSGRLMFVRPSLARKLFGSTTTLFAADVRRPPGAFNNASLRSVAEQDPVADAIGPTKRECDAREYVTESILQGKTKNDGNHARGGDQGAGRHAENEGKDRQSSAEIDDTHDEVLEKTGLPGLALEDEKDAHEADDRPCQMHPPKQLRGYEKKRAGILRSITFEPVRGDVVADKNGGH